MILSTPPPPYGRIDAALRCSTLQHTAESCLQRRYLTSGIPHCSRLWTPSAYALQETSNPSHTPFKSARVPWPQQKPGTPRHTIILFVLQCFNSYTPRSKDPFAQISAGPATAAPGTGNKTLNIHRCIQSREKEHNIPPKQPRQLFKETCGSYPQLLSPGWDEPYALLTTLFTHHSPTSQQNPHTPECCPKTVIKTMTTNRDQKHVTTRVQEPRQTP